MTFRKQLMAGLHLAFAVCSCCRSASLSPGPAAIVFCPFPNEMGLNPLPPRLHLETNYELMIIIMIPNDGRALIRVTWEDGRVRKHQPNKGVLCTANIIGGTQHPLA